MVKIIWTEFALEDLKAIHEYISQDSKVYAGKFIEKLINRVDQKTFLNLEDRFRNLIWKQSENSLKAITESFTKLIQITSALCGYITRRDS
ncbi:hypothetical protein BH09BAC3_BH09BAC3_24490 [soil metagenome]